MATAAYVLILLAMGEHGMAVGTSQAIFADKASCESAGHAAQDAGGSYSWSNGTQLSGFGPRFLYRCVPQGEGSK